MQQIARSRHSAKYIDSGIKIKRCLFISFGKLVNVKIMTPKEFKDAYFGTYDERAMYYLVSKYGYKYDVAKAYLDNFLFAFLYSILYNVTC